MKNLLAPSIVAAAPGPLLHVQMGPGGRTTGAVAAVRIAASPARVWSVVRDLDAYPGRVPMIDRAELDGDRVSMQLRFRLAIFSAKFGFTARARWEDESWLELSYLTGEPEGIRLRIELAPDGPDATIAYTSVSFEVRSLGWLVKYFLKHHPEIEHGIFPGSALVLIDSFRKIAEASPGS